ncbi:MAG: preprotein translocase subunit YajC [Gaiellaceae bacterium]|jgi:preprotein translocase subunit YajC|nr:preprotein translocase subunit YajC [Gaiellaceae bacterium]
MNPGFLILFLVVFAAYFVIVALPRKRARVAQADLLAGIDPGDEVLTAGGLIGIVQEIDGDIVQLEVAPGVTVRLDLRAIAGRVLPEDEAAAATEPLEPG